MLGIGLKADANLNEIDRHARSRRQPEHCLSIATYRRRVAHHDSRFGSGPGRDLKTLAICAGLSGAFSLLMRCRTQP
jgi:hypothetical protein